jgi:hypothetical protein
VCVCVRGLDIDLRCSQLLIKSLLCSDLKNPDVLPGQKEPRSCCPENTISFSKTQNAKELRASQSYKNALTGEIFSFFEDLLSL